MYDMFQTQMSMEEMYAKNHLISRIKEEYIKAGAEEFLTKKEIPVEFGVSLLTQMYLHKRATPAVLVGILYRHFAKDYDNPFQACANALYYAASQDVMDWKDLDGRFVVKPQFLLSEEVQKELDQFQFPLPMIVEPLPITNNRETGYYTIKGSVILKDNHHEDDVVLEHLNTMNSIKLSMNPDTVRMIQNQWRNHDRPKEDESFEDYQKRMKAFDKFDKTSREILEGLFILGNEFYLTHKYDKRGRTYCQGYHVTYQGNDWSKGILEFADKEICNDMPQSG